MDSGVGVKVGVGQLVNNPEHGSPEVDPHNFNNKLLRPGTLATSVVVSPNEPGGMLRFHALVRACPLVHLDHLRQ